LPSSNHSATCGICSADAAFLRGARPDYESRKPAIRLVDLFAGCGGLSLGVAHAAWQLNMGTRVKLAVDSDPNAVAVYKANFPEAKVRNGLVEEMFDGKLGEPPTARESKLLRKIGRVDVLVGGPPCQGHSDLNNHTRRADPRNALYARMARAAEVLRPRALLIENVPTVQHDVGQVVDVTIDALRAARFAVADLVIDLANLGTPQRRRRHVILALSGRRRDPKVILKSLGVRCEKHPERTVSWAIEDLIEVGEDGIFDTASAASEENVRRMRYLFDKDVHDLPNSLRPICHQSEHSYRSMYGRLWWDEPANTVTTGFGSMGQGRYVHPSRPRTLTPHEAARIQMLPDFMDFSDVNGRGALARLIGNAVPTVLGVGLGEKILPPLKKKAMKKQQRRGGGLSR
jgi:DNA (cytosine-5)-methyltransferase 1